MDRADLRGCEGCSEQWSRTLKVAIASSKPPNSLRNRLQLIRNRSKSVTSQPSAVGGSFLFLRSARRHADFKGLPFPGFVFEGGDCGGWSFGVKDGLLLKSEVWGLGF